MNGLETDNTRCTSGLPPTGAEAFYLRSVAYADHGAVERQELGNNLWESIAYNDRLQPEDMRLGTTQDGSQVWRSRLSYDPAGGDLRRPVRRRQQRQYPLAPAQTISPSTNRITGVAGYPAAPPQYDAAGNMTFHPQIGTMAYDAENRQTSFSGAGKTGEYVYDGDGHRIKRVSGGIGGSTALFVYDAFGRLAAEYAPTAPSGAARTEYRTTDHLGSTRVVTDGAGAVVARRDFYPFGGRIENTYGNRQQIAAYAATPGFKQRFTATERDDESGLDYFGARYLSASLGRFTSVDPGGAGARKADPTTWNAYAYTSNNPLVFVDPDGKEKLRVTYNTFIPDSATFFPVPAKGDGREFGQTGSSRTSQSAVIETDVARNQGNLLVSSEQKAGFSAGVGLPFPTVGTTGFNSGLGFGKASGSTLSLGTTRTEGGGALVKFRGNEAFPLAPSPGITFDVNVTITPGEDGSLVVGVTGTSGPFPAHEVVVEALDRPGSIPVVIPLVDPRTLGTTTFDLFPIDEPEVNGSGQIR